MFKPDGGSSTDAELQTGGPHLEAYLRHTSGFTPLFNRYFLSVTKSGKNQSQFVLSGEVSIRSWSASSIQKALSAEWYGALTVSGEGPARALGSPDRAMPTTEGCPDLTVWVKVKLLHGFCDCMCKRVHAFACRYVCECVHLCAYRSTSVCMRTASGGHTRSCSLPFHQGRAGEAEEGALKPLH